MFSFWLDPSCKDPGIEVMLICIASFSWIPTFLQEEAGTVKTAWCPLLWCGFSVVGGISGVHILAKGNPSGLKDFFDTNQLNLLAVSIALAAYTSVILGKIHASLKRRKERRNDDDVRLNRNWLLPGDILLVLFSLLLMVRLVLFVGKINSPCFDLSLMGLFGAAIIQLAMAHARQWCGYLK